MGNDSKLEFALDLGGQNTIIVVGLLVEVEDEPLVEPVGPEKYAEGDRVNHWHATRVEEGHVQQSEQVRVSVLHHEVITSVDLFVVTLSQLSCPVLRASELLVVEPTKEVQDVEAAIRDVRSDCEEAQRQADLVADFTVPLGSELGVGYVVGVEGHLPPVVIEVEVLERNDQPDRDEVERTHFHDLRVRLLAVTLFLLVSRQDSHEKLGRRGDHRDEGRDEYLEEFELLELVVPLVAVSRRLTISIVCVAFFEMSLAFAVE